MCIRDRLYYYIITLVCCYPPAAPTNRHRAVGLDIGLLDLTREFWSQVGTFFQLVWAQNGHHNDTKMTPKWHQNRPKMAPRWLLGGSWGHLGGKMAPRWSQEGSKVEKPNSFPPCWGPSWDKFLDIFITGVDYKRLEEPLGWHVVSRHQFLSENGSPGTPFGHTKSSQSVVLSSKIKVFGLPFKVALGRGLGTLFGTILGPKLTPSWAMLGTKLA